MPATCCRHMDAPGEYSPTMNKTGERKELTRDGTQIKPKVVRKGLPDQITHHDYLPPFFSFSLYNRRFYRFFEMDNFVFHLFYDRRWFGHAMN